MIHCSATQSNICFVDVKGIMEITYPAPFMLRSSPLRQEPSTVRALRQKVEGGKFLQPYLNLMTKAAPNLSKLGQKHQSHSIYPSAQASEISLREFDSFLTWIPGTLIVFCFPIISPPSRTQNELGLPLLLNQKLGDELPGLFWDVLKFFIF